MQQRSSGSVQIFYPPWSREQLLARLQEGVSALREVLPLTLVVLFGSYARDRQTASSDVDLLVVYAGPRREDTYALVRRTLGIRGLEPHVYTEEEHTRLQDILDSMVQDGIVLYSVADFQGRG